MYETDSILLGDSDYLAGLQHLVTALNTTFPGNACSYHPDKGEAVDGKIVHGSFIDAAQFSVGPLGKGPTLLLSRSEIRTCYRGVVAEVKEKIDQFITQSRA